VNKDLQGEMVLMVNLVLDTQELPDMQGQLDLPVPRVLPVLKVPRVSAVLLAPRV
jgi:hypothetical protein